MATAHINAEKGDIARTVLMPGDPLRAKFIAENFLTDAVIYNEVRGMLGYTGFYRGMRVSVQGSGMGVPSMGIYSYELFNFYGVQSIIRIGTCGAFQDKIKLGDIVFAQAASTDSNYGKQFGVPGVIAAAADYPLLEAAVGAAKAKNTAYFVGTVVTSDAFYEETSSAESWAKMGTLAVEMETYALYLNAVRVGKRALGLFTVSDEIYSGNRSSAQERQNSFTSMMQIALETSVIAESFD